MSKKYSLLYFAALIVISGCVETQAEKMGWNQAKYEEYSAYYDVLRPHSGETVNKTEYDVISKGLTIDEWLISVPKDKNEFENTWYLVFYHIKKAQDTPLDTFPCRVSDAPLANEVMCQNIRQKRHMEKANVSYSKATEYRQKIEDMKMNLSR